VQPYEIVTHRESPGAPHIAKWQIGFYKPCQAIRRFALRSTAIPVSSSMLLMRPSSERAETAMMLTCCPGSRRRTV